MGEAVTSSMAGAGVGEGLGPGVGREVIAEVGASVGSLVGSGVGSFVGAEVVGASVGAFVGSGVGSFVGVEVGASVGSFVGAEVGASVGSFVGDVVGGSALASHSPSSYDASTAANNNSAQEVSFGSKNPIIFHEGRIEFTWPSHRYDRTGVAEEDACPGKRFPKSGVKWYGSGPTCDWAPHVTWKKGTWPALGVDQPEQAFVAAAEAQEVAVPSAVVAATETNESPSL